MFVALLVRETTYEYQDLGAGGVFSGGVADGSGRRGGGQCGRSPVYSYAEVVIVRGRAVGTYAAPGQQVSQSFETRNLFVFRRIPGGKLQVWQIIFNHVPKTT